MKSQRRTTILISRPSVGMEFVEESMKVLAITIAASMSIGKCHVVVSLVLQMDVKSARSLLSCI